MSTSTEITFLPYNLDKTTIKSGSCEAPLQVSILGASLSTDNMGVATLASGVVKSIMAYYPEAGVFFLDYSPAEVEHRLLIGEISVSIPTISMRFSKKLFMSNNITTLLLLAILRRGLPKRLQKTLPSATNRCLRQILGADLIVSIAGGDSFSDIYGLARLAYVSLPQILALLLGKPLVLMPQTLGPFQSRTSKIVARFIMKRAKAVFSRDRYGVTEMPKVLALNGASPIRFCYDVGFVLDPVKPERVVIEGADKELAEVARPLVGLNISGLLYMGGYTRDNMFGLKVDYRLLMEKLIDRLISDKKATVLLVPHVFGEGEKSESDSRACEIVYQQLKPRYGDKLLLVKGRYNQNEIKHIIGQCDFFLGARMHACIAALSQHIPTVPIAYSRKFIGVMETVGVDAYVADPREMDEEQILKVLDGAWAEREKIGAHLTGIMPEVKGRVLNLFREIEDAMAESPAGR